MNCPKCGQPVPDGSRFCPSCGTPIPDYSKSTPQAPSKETPAAKNQNNDAATGIVILFAIIAVLAYGYFHCWFSHVWQPATCDRPSVCSRCNKTKGSPLGHQLEAGTCVKAPVCKVCKQEVGNPAGHIWMPATCKRASFCAICDIEQGSPIDHLWQPATERSPERCTRCGETRGTIKGYYPTLDGKWSSVSVQVNSTQCHPWIFTNPVKNCKKFTMHFQIDEVKYGYPYGAWRLYAKINGKWKIIDTFEVTDNSEVARTITFDKETTFTQLTVAKSSFAYNAKWSQYLWFDDFYVKE